MSRINEKIKQRIKDLGLTQIEVANRINEEAEKDGLKLNVNNKTLSRWIRGYNKLDVDILKYICLALDIDANFLFDFEIKQEKKSQLAALKEALKNSGFFEDDEDISEETLEKLSDFIDRNIGFLKKDNGDISIDTLVEFIIANKGMISK